MHKIKYFNFFKVFVLNDWRGRGLWVVREVIQEVPLCFSTQNQHYTSTVNRFHCASVHRINTTLLQSIGSTVLQYTESTLHFYSQSQAVPRDTWTLPRNRTILLRKLREQKLLPSWCCLLTNTEPPSKCFNLEWYAKSNCSRYHWTSVTHTSYHTFLSLLALLKNIFL